MKPRELTPQEQVECQQGEYLAELKQSQGWQILDRWLRDRAYHSWVDPKQFKNKEDWYWAELNLYHNADVARQILEDMDVAISRAVDLRKEERGEGEANKFKEIWSKLNG